MKKLITCILAGLCFNASANSESMKVLIENIAKARYEQQALNKKDVNSEYKLVLFYSNKCPYCIKFAPVLKRYSENSQLSVEAISLTEQTLPEFPNSVYATQEMIDLAYQGRPVIYPALFVANPKTHKIYPVSFGMLDDGALKSKMDSLLPKIKQYEGKI